MLEPGSKIGILGGGQLGRMLAVAATRLGFKSHIFEPAKTHQLHKFLFKYRQPLMRMRRPNRVC